LKPNFVCDKGNLLSANNRQRLRTPHPNNFLFVQVAALKYRNLSENKYAQHRKIKPPTTESIRFFQFSMNNLQPEFAVFQGGLIKLYQFGMVVLLLCFIMSADYAHCQNDLSAAERVARGYMTAFFRGDFEKAAKLTHPDTLATLKHAFLIKLDQAQADGRQSELLKEIGIKIDVGTLRRKNPHDFYVAITKSNQKRGNADALKAMKGTKVEVIDSELLNANEATVQLRIQVPADAGGGSRAGGLLLRRYKKYWRVKTNVE